jgi:NAD(P)-dependent dehydrogenase (short-subunit alcohol dehydrogenase family)
MMHNFESLNGQVALITGANRGIGWAICASLLKYGVHVVMTGRNLQQVQLAAAKTNNNRIMAIELDVRNPESVSLAVDKVICQFGRIDILVNNAGINKISSFTELRNEDFDEIMNVNLRGTYLVCKEVVPIMVKQRKGKIINIASQAGKSGEAYNSAYSASKFAVIGLTQSLALELGKHSIMICAICPGPVDTQLLRESIVDFAHIYEKSTEAYQSDIIKQTAIGRLLSPEDVASIVTYLVCNESDAFTGGSVQVTGGVTMW